MRISFWQKPYWKVFGGKWFEFHFNRCHCSLRRCRRAKKGKDYIDGLRIRFGKVVIRIDRRKPKECLAPF